MCFEVTSHSGKSSVEQGPLAQCTCGGGRWRQSLDTNRRHMNYTFLYKKKVCKKMRLKSSKS